MKKRILGIMLTMCMLLSALPLTSIVATAAENVSTQSVASATGAEVVSVKLNGTANGGFNKYAVKVSGTASKVQVIFPNANTYTFNRSGSEAKNDNSRGVVSIKAYDKDNNEVALGSDNTASELWVINMALKEGTYTVRAKYKNTWEAKGKTVTVSYSVKTPEEVKVTKVEGKDGSYSFKLDGTAQKIQVIHPNKMTNTFTKSNSSVSVKYYNSENAEVDRDSGEAAYEIWTISKKYNDGSYSVIAKYNNGTTYVWGTTALAFDITNGEVDITLDSDKLNALSAFTYEKNSDGKVKITGVKDNSVTEIVVPDFVYEIARGAFKDCTSLEKLTVPYVGNRSNGEYYSIGYIFGSKSFKKNNELLPTSLKEVTVTGGYSNDETIRTNAFYNCQNLTSINIEDGITHIEEAIFFDCLSLEQLTLPFCGDADKKITDLEVRSFGWAFSTKTNASGNQGCKNLVSDVYDDYYILFREVGDRRVVPSSLKSVTIKSGVISKECFVYLEKIEKVVLGEGVTYIGDWCFQGCENLKELSVLGTPEYVGEYKYMLYGTELKTKWEEEAKNGDGFIYLNDTVLLAYIGTDENVEIREGTVVIAPRAFGYDTADSVKSVKCPSTLKRISDYNSDYKTYNLSYSAFRPNLEKIELNEGLEYIGNFAFRDCEKLTEITIPQSVVHIGIRAFDNTGWYNNQPDGPVYIDDVLYAYKGTLPENTTYTVREGTTGIAHCAFMGQTNLVGINIPNSVTWIGQAAFCDCSLTSIDLPDNLTSIGYCAFLNCAIQEIIIPKGVKTLPFVGGIYGSSTKLKIKLEEGSQLEIIAEEATNSIYISGDVIVLPESVRYIEYLGVRGMTVLLPINTRLVVSASSCTFYYMGSKEQAKPDLPGTIFYYSEDEPDVDENGDYNDNYWHYDENGNITVWE